jgi:hypothetical protein
MLVFILTSIKGYTYHEKKSLKIPPKISIPLEMGKNASIHVLANKSTTSRNTSLNECGHKYKMFFSCSTPRNTIMLTKLVVLMDVVHQDIICGDI